MSDTKRHDDLSLSEKVTKLEEALKRLMDENAQYRDNLERINIVIRKRAPKNEGLSYPEIVRSVLDERDGFQDQVNTHREFLKKVKTTLAENPQSVREVYDIISMFMVNSKK